MGREALGINSLIPYRRHRPALDDEEDDLSRVTEDDKCYEEPEKAREGLPRAINDPQHEETDRDLHKTNADVVHDLRPYTPFQCNWNVFLPKTVNMLPNARLDHFRQKCYTDDCKHLSDVYQYGYQR